MVILVTGASGYIGSRLVTILRENHTVMTMSRRRQPDALAPVTGDFTSREDLTILDPHPIDLLIHLAAETGDSTEEASMSVNVGGTRRLLRYLIDHGCPRFMLASSIAAVGTNDWRFRPETLPIPESHRPIPYDPYGLSKALMEQVAAYFYRRSPSIEMTLFRFGWVHDPVTWKDPLVRPDPPLPPFLELTKVMLDDILRLLVLAVDRPLGGGFRVFNAVGPDAASDQPVAEFLRQALGEEAASLELSHYRDGLEFDAIFSMDAVREAYGFEPNLSVRPSNVAAPR